MPIPKQNLFLLILSAFLLVGCSTSKNLRKSPAPARTNQEVLQALQDHNIDFQTIQFKSGLDFQSAQESGSASAQWQMKVDSLVWVAVKKLSIEGARALITRDSFFIIDRINKVVELGKVKNLPNFDEFDFELVDIQQLLAGNIILPPTNQNPEIKKDSAMYIIQTQISPFQVSYAVSAHTLEVDRTEIFLPRKNIKLSILFEDYRKTKGGKKYSYKRKYIIDGLEANSVTLALKLSDLKINELINPVFQIPRRYEMYRR